LKPPFQPSLRAGGNGYKGVVAHRARHHTD
jgi:hypothetical protein